MKYCTYCGKEIMEEAVICLGCGCPVGNIHFSGDMNPRGANNDVLLKQLTRKIKAEIQLWSWIAIAQAVIGVILLVNALVDGEFFIGLPISLFVVAIINFLTVLDIKRFANRINERPVDIVKRYESFYRYVFNFIYNLVFGGIVGIAGSIYGIMTRNFVLKNETAFSKIENNI